MGSLWLAVGSFWWAVGSLRLAVASFWWAVGSGQLLVDSGQLLARSGQLLVGSGQLLVGSGQWAASGWQWAAFGGQWAVGSFWLTVGSFWRAVGSFWWAVGSGQPLVGISDTSLLHEAQHTCTSFCGFLGVLRYIQFTTAAIAAAATSKAWQLTPSRRRSRHRFTIATTAVKCHDLHLLNSRSTSEQGPPKSSRLRVH